MQLLRRERPGGPVKVSFVLLDWGCRESFHMLDYLADQTVPRGEYEVLWIEYYDGRPVELEQRKQTAAAEGRQAPIDTHVVLEMPRSTYYHKHLMYNVGLALAAGEIVCICDSDTMVGRTFVESIVREFEADPDIVLHLDEVRNHDRGFYPFRYPAFEDVRGPGSTTMIDRRPLGMCDTDDPLHTRNYGACMAARRERLLAIGGADMHIDYLGHVCGPYEMTFRLLNAGNREVWHNSEFLYHTWHPGQAGDNNYHGPHDGQSMSTTALAVRSTGRTLPLEENPALARLRNGEPAAEAELLAQLVRPEWLDQWNTGRISTEVRSRSVGWGEIRVHESQGAQPADVKHCRRPFASTFGFIARLWAIPVLVGLFWRQWRSRKHTPLPPSERLPSAPSGHLGRLLGPVLDLTAFFRRMWAYNRHLLKQCWIHLLSLADAGTRECVLYGEGDVAGMLVALSRLGPVRIRAMCPVDPQSTTRWPGVEVVDESQLRDSPHPVIVAAFANVDRHAKRLMTQGVPRERLVLLQ